MSVCLKTLAQLHKMMRGKFPVLLEKYLRETEALIVLLSESVSAEERVRAAHSIKSTAAAFGAFRLSGLAEECEACNCGPSQRCAILAEQLRVEFVSTKVELQKYLASLDEPSERIMP